MDPLERHLRPKEIADAWNMAHSTIIELFRDEPGVMIVERPETRRKRGYRSLYIPISVAARVKARLSARPPRAIA